jgi:hypothetical protein
MSGDFHGFGPINALHGNQDNCALKSENTNRPGISNESPRGDLSGPFFPAALVRSADPIGFNSDLVVDGALEPLFATQVFFSGLNRNVT